MTEEFTKELTELLNKHSKENDSDTPDFILSNFLTGVLEMYNDAVQKRQAWYGIPIGNPFPFGTPQRVEEDDITLPPEEVVFPTEDEKSPMQKILDEMLEQIAKDRRALLDNILSNPGFGATYGDDFIVEFQPSQVLSEQDREDRGMDEFRLIIEQKWRIRKRTDEERTQDIHTNLIKDSLRQGLDGNIESV